MSLMRVFVKVDAEGKISVPLNIQRETGLKKGGLIELRVVGAGKQQKLVISTRHNAR
ncbi:MAG: hypothetical protein HYZ81_22565 [Nitrospinae bacterium]|nr:hypothetical protein [Nitrospinota bacterium]